MTIKHASTALGVVALCFFLAALIRGDQILNILGFAVLLIAVVLKKKADR